jgi:hypothetical protein
MAAVRYEVDRRDAPAGGSSIGLSCATYGGKTHATSNIAEDTDVGFFAQ